MIALLYIEWKSGSHVFAASLTASDTKRANLTWLPLEIMQSCITYTTWLPVTLSVLGMIIENFATRWRHRSWPYAFGQLENEKIVISTIDLSYLPAGRSV